MPMQFPFPNEFLSFRRVIVIADNIKTFPVVKEYLVYIVQTFFTGQWLR